MSSIDPNVECIYVVGRVLKIEKLIYSTPLYGVFFNHFAKMLANGRIELYLLNVHSDSAIESFIFQLCTNIYILCDP